MCSITATPTAERRAAFTLAVVSKVAPTAQKISSVTPTPTADKTGNSYLSCSVKTSTISSEMGSITPTPTAERRAAFTLAVVSNVAPTAVKLAA